MKRELPNEVRLLSEEEAAAILRKGGATHATARTLRWLLQLEGAPKRDDFQVNLAAVAEFLRRKTGKKAPGLRGAAALFDLVVPEKARPRALTYAERQAKSQAKSGRGDIAGDLDLAIEGINWKLRTRAEHDFLFFLKTYCTSDDPSHGCFLEIPPESDEMKQIVRDMEQAIGDASIPFHIRVARGHGKTSDTKGGVLWTAATGKRHYTVAVAANEDNAENIIKDVFRCICQSPAFIRDFPEVSVPFLVMAGAYQRAKTQKYHGKATNAQCSSNKIVLPTIINPKTGRPFPSSGAILEAVGFNAGARGKSSGILRPDFVIFDDLQNDDKAGSEMQVEKMVLKIKKTFMQLGGHRKKIAAVMTSTPIEANDLSETFAADTGWKTKTYRMVISWPRCHDLDAKPEDRKGVRDLWQEYWDIFDEEKAADRLPHIAANRFYRKNRKEMDAGAKVLNPKNYDRTTELSGIQHAMNILHRDGLETFMSEFQMAPPRNSFAFELTSKLILSRRRAGVPARTIPADTVLTVAATDINPGYALTTTIITFDIRMTAFVTAYHATPVKISERLNDTEFDAKLSAALADHAQEIMNQGVKIDLWGIDCGGRQFTTVTRFAQGTQARFGVRGVAMLGRGGQAWNPNVRSRIRQEKNATILCRDSARRKWLAWNADEYKEKAHLAWNTDPGAAGGLSLFDGGANHVKFAVQVANEKLVAKTKAKSRDGRDYYAYKWKTRNPHDYGDCLAMCFALAGSEGLTGTGETMAAKKSTHLAIGGQIVGADTEKPAEEQKPAEESQPQMAKPKKRIAIGGHLF